MISNSGGEPYFRRWLVERTVVIGVCPGSGLWDLSSILFLFLFLFILFLPDLWCTYLLSHEVPWWYVILSNAPNKRATRSWTKTSRILSQDNFAYFYDNFSVIMCQCRKLTGKMAFSIGCSSILQKSLDVRPLSTSLIHTHWSVVLCGFSIVS